ncbi:MAG: hypothetical protein OQK12_18435 [Motiliproteus sp.]|nr:hypothetical protein [Motiliproteus sp.]MCW9053000.1 hypothetical protein [Motiliproteus sp.]
MPQLSLILFELFNQNLQRWLAISLVLLLLAGCKQGMIHPGFTTEQTSLEQWLEREAAPYLQDQLTSQHRFENQRLKISKLVADRAHPGSDALTEQIDQRLQQVIIASGRVRLVTQTNSQVATTSLDCHRQQQFDYLLGIAINPISGDTHQIRIRIMDAGDRSWVKGFDLQWQEKLDRQQIIALNTPQAGEQVRGERTLPFQPNQTDMLAQHLARELSCRILENRDQAAKVYLPSHHPDPLIQQIYGQLPHYLAQFKEANPVSKKQQAEILINAKLQPIDGQLHQLWINASEQDGGLIAGVNSDAYIQIAPLAQRLSPAPKVVSKTPDKSQTNQRSQVISVEPVIEPPLKKQTLGLDQSSLFSRLLTPVHPKLCRSSNPWRRGERSQSAAGDFTAQRCFALELDVPKGYQTFLISEQANGQLIRLAPDTCQGLVRFSKGSGRTETLRFPSKRSQRSNALQLKENSQTYYAVAIPKNSGTQSLRKQLTRLPGQCGNRSSYADNHFDTHRWLARLQKLADQQTGVIWQAKTVHRDRTRSKLNTRYQDSAWATY